MFFQLMGEIAGAVMMGGTNGICYFCLSLITLLVSLVPYNITEVRFEQFRGVS